MKEALAKILVVDDEPQIRKFLRISLAACGYAVIEAATGEEGVARCVARRPDLVVLDLGLPDADGDAVVARIRRHRDVPILILSVRDSEEEKVRLLNTGAYDYVTKPFHVAELIARVRVGLRFHSTLGRVPASLHLDAVDIDLVARTVTSEAGTTRLSPREYDILRLLAARPGHVLTHEMLMREVWGSDDTDTIHHLRVIVGRLRRKLGEDPVNPAYIVTEPGVGYRFAACAA